MNMMIVNHLNEDDWRRFVYSSPDGNIYHTPEMFEIFSRTRGYQPELWAALDEQSEILALMLPVHVTLRNGLLRSLTTRSIVYGGTLAVPGITGQNALATLLAVYKKSSGRRPVFTEIRNVSDSTGLQATLNTAGFTYEDHLNYLIRLVPEPDEVFNRIGHRTQKNIRRGLKKALVEIKEVQDPEDLHDGYDLLRRTYQHARVPLADQSLFQSAFELLTPKGMFMATLAKVEGSPAAASFELLYKDTLTGWYGGMDRAFSAYVPNELLMWYILKSGCEKGYRMYDFGGAGKPDEEYGVRDFKAKFGGDLVNFGRNTWVPHPALLSLSRLGYKVYRSVLSVGNNKGRKTQDDPPSVTG